MDTTGRAVIALTTKSDLRTLDTTTLDLLEQCMEDAHPATAASHWRGLSKATGFRGSDVARLGTRSPHRGVRYNSWLAGGLPAEEALEALETEPQLRVRAAIIASYFFDADVANHALAGLDLDTAQCILGSRNLAAKDRPRAFPTEVWVNVLNLVNGHDLHDDERNTAIKALDDLPALGAAAVADTSMLLEWRVRVLHHPAVTPEQVVATLAEVTDRHRAKDLSDGDRNTALVNAQRRPTLTSAEYDAIATCARATLAPRARKGFADELEKRRTKESATMSLADTVAACSIETDLLALVTSLDTGQLATSAARTLVVSADVATLRVLRAVAEAAGVDLSVVAAETRRPEVLWEDLSFATDFMAEADMLTACRVRDAMVKAGAQDRFVRAVADGTVTLDRRLWRMDMSWPQNLPGVAARVPLDLVLGNLLSSQNLIGAVLTELTQLASTPQGRGVLNGFTMDNTNGMTVGDMGDLLAAATS